MPYGETRGTTPVWTGTKGYVGGTSDDTGLTHLGAREYDPSLGRFTSRDPITNLTDPQQIHGYAYSHNNPTTYTDPTGLYDTCDNDGNATCPTEPPPGEIPHPDPTHNNDPRPNQPGPGNTTGGNPLLDCGMTVCTFMVIPDPSPSPSNREGQGTSVNFGKCAPGMVCDGPIRMECESDRNSCVLTVEEHGEVIFFGTCDTPENCRIIVEACKKTGPCESFQVKADPDFVEDMGLISSYIEIGATAGFMVGCFIGWYVVGGCFAIGGPLGLAGGTVGFVVGVIHVAVRRIGRTD